MWKVPGYRPSEPPSKTPRRRPNSKRLRAPECRIRKGRRAQTPGARADFAANPPGAECLTGLPRRRTAAPLRHILRARRSTCTPQIPISGSGPTGPENTAIPRARQSAIRPDTCARHSLPRLAAMADGPAARRRPKARPRCRHEHRALSRSGSRHRPLRLRSLGAPAFFIPDAASARRPTDFSPTGQDWSFPPPNAARHREDGYRLLHGVDPQNDAPRRRAAHRPRDAPVPPLLDSARVIPPPTALMSGSSRRIWCASSRSKASVTRGGYRRRPGHGGRRSPPDSGRFRHIQLSMLELRTSMPKASSRRANIPSRRSPQPPRRICPPSPDSGRARTSKRAFAAGTIDKRLSNRRRPTALHDKQHLLDALFAMDLLPPDYERDADRIPLTDAASCITPSWGTWRARPRCCGWSIRKT